jgi:HD-GYP domain-containing protein (c-di-GMP phosphodiesterase class II)
LSAHTHPTIECLSALSVILDLANGLEEDKSLLTATFALALAQEAGCTAEEQAAAFFAALLRHLGCTAYASVESTLATDDISLRSRLNHVDPSRVGDVLSAVSHANPRLVDRGLSVLRLATQSRTLRNEWTSEACGAARVLSEQLRLGPRVSLALDEVYERWDGAGSPKGLGGEALSRVGRVAQVAHVAAVFWLAGGLELARDTLRARAGTLLDPRLTERALEQVHQLDEDDFLHTRLDAVSRLPEALALDTSIEAIAEAFGDFADLQTPFTRGHSRAVARVADAAAAHLGLPAAERQELKLAAHLHDIGQVAVATSVWTRPRSFRPTERERARSHVYFTERVLASAAPLARVAKIAGAHHERLDGTGYHRGLKQSALVRPARLLAVADAACGMQEARPHRAALSRDAAAKLLREQVKEGALDEDCVGAVLAALGERRSAAAASAPALTARELDVLRLLATGKTNKEIAQQLAISGRTVQHHTIHIYEKLGVDTRAAAALLAVRHGLLEAV